MKRHKQLYPKVYSFGHLWFAWERARRGKAYTAAAAAFQENLDEELVRLHDELQAETWQPGPYRSFTIHEPKRRKISAAPFRDRVVHHALTMVLEPIYEARFISDSYANRVGKGTHRALDRCTEFMRRYRYVMLCDVESFFPAIDHAILRETLAMKIGDPAVLRLCEKIIASGEGILTDEYRMRYFPGDDLFVVQRPRGLPIGNMTSQFWANVYLDRLDQFVKHTLRVKGYLRYVDDFVLFADDKADLWRWRDEIIGFLETLRLTIHMGSAQPRPVTQGLGFLGFTVFPDHRRLKRRKGIGYRRHLRGLLADYRAERIPLEAVQASVMAWIGHVQHGDTWGLRKAVLRDVVI